MFRPISGQVNTVFQKYALFPHLNVFENVAFGLRIGRTVTEEVNGRTVTRKEKIPDQEIHDRVMEILEIVNLKGFEKRSISALSGGQQQRVAIARALVNRPKVLLLDEPLGALDLRLRKDMQNELKRIQQQMGITFIYVTHDQEEALAMSDTVVVMDERPHPADRHAGGHLQRAEERLRGRLHRRVQHHRRHHAAGRRGGDLQPEVPVPRQGLRAQ